MPWVKFSENFDWDVPRYNGSVTIAYKAGTTKLVTQGCADRAKALGKGKVVVNPKGRKNGSGTTPGTVELSETN
jgi:hypothetical protein